jgi:hypothetical protein
MRMLLWLLLLLLLMMMVVPMVVLACCCCCRRHLSRHLRCCCCGRHLAVCCKHAMDLSHLGNRICHRERMRRTYKHKKTWHNST